MHMDSTCLYCLAFISLALICGLEGWCTTSATYVDLFLSAYDARRRSDGICLEAGWRGIQLVEHI
jgi:hypothetical protein